MRPSHVLLTRIDRHTAAPARTHTLTPGVSVLAVVDRVSTAPARTPAEASTMARAQKLIGHRVVVSPCVPCSTCELCTRGLSTHCPRRTIMGISGRDGGLADELIMPAANLLPVPESMNDEHAVFAFLAGAAAHAAASFRVEGKPYITVLGDGPMALLCVQAMARLNASVRLLGRHESKLSLCERWGIKHRPEHEAGRRNDQDVVIDCTGSPEGPAIATGLLRPRGRLVVKSCVSLGVGEPSEAASGDSIAPGVMDAIVRSEIEVLGSREGTIGEGLALIQKGHIQTDGLITRRAKLEDAPAILREQRPGEIAALIEIK
ncbi:MAG: alcohol dehydrogenase catalytic domain-containing protein [Phycisphaerales bacterium]|nr:alcohol dehydrogenase catalytic domain-containing protein [Phycisphaerales bacterium]